MFAVYFRNPLSVPHQVEGKDLAGNLRRCFREVVVEDTQRPVWLTPTKSVSKSFTMLVDGPRIRVSWTFSLAGP